MSKLNATVRAVLGEVGRTLVDKAAAVDKAAPADAAKPDGRSARDMRCKHVGADGRRCRERSRGPRFNYRCKKHEQRRRAKKKPKPEPEKQGPGA